MHLNQYLTTLILICSSTLSIAQVHTTHRVQQFHNDKVNVWKTVIYPSQKHGLSMHRHEYDRVVVALTDGTLKITNDKGKAHYLHLKKDQAYYLHKDFPHELHSDENISKHPIEVMVVELKH